MLFSVSAVLTAFIVGFAMKRGGLCTYAAALQIVQQHKAERMLAFLGAAAWATVVVVPLFWLFPDWVKLSNTHDFIVTAMCGGLIFGLGAYLNKGCMFGTFVQLVGGNLTYVATLIGLSIGVVISYQNFAEFIPVTPSATQIAEPGFIAYGWLLSVSFFALLMIFKTKSGNDSASGFRKNFFFRDKATILIMLALGIGGGLLSAVINGWDYAAVLTQFTHDVINVQEVGPEGLSIACALSMVAGGIYAAVSAGSFRIQMPRFLFFIACLIGGVLMGIAGIIIPGGNDGMLLKGIPSFAMHSIVAYTVMVAVMIILIAFFRRKPI